MKEDPDRPLLTALEDARWFAPALRALRALPLSADQRLRRLLRAGDPVWIGRAPGRLDVMGGIGDYSGSVVLELPLALATFAMLQGRSDGMVRVISLRAEGSAEAEESLEALLACPVEDAAGIGESLRRQGRAWAAYVMGVIHSCVHRAAGAGGDRPPGFNLLIVSELPEGSGVSSSAALEVATMCAVGVHLRLALGRQEIAAACQRVENEVVGAPCGIMDQLTSALGRANRLLRLRCQPAVVEGHLAIPAEYRFFGIDSGIRHAVSGEDYGSVRTAAFMGYRILAEAAGLRVGGAREQPEVEDPRWGGYLANLSPSELRELEHHLPEQMQGGEFLTRFGGHTDPVTVVRPDRMYRIRAATRHPILENARAERFSALLGDLPSAVDAGAEMGRLMYESHESYGACGLGSQGTDRLVELVRSTGPEAGLLGAKITGGGSGGTVAVLARRDAEAAVRRIAARYAAETGAGGEVFAESGPGAAVLRWQEGS